MFLHAPPYSNYIIFALHSSDGTSTTEFEVTPRTSTYLIAFIISDFQYISSAPNSAIPHRAISRPNALGLNSLILEAGVKILDAIADYVSVEYTLPKMDQVAVPDFNPGAMENWGIVTYREERFFWNESVNTHTYKTALITVIAHEFGHQWFGNLVGPSWWTYIWLNEGFANLFEHIGVDLVSNHFFKPISFNIHQTRSESITVFT